MADVAATTGQSKEILVCTGRVGKGFNKYQNSFRKGDSIIHGWFIHLIFFLKLL